jgi:hypothetical protein
VASISAVTFNIADACRVAIRGNMPVSEGFVNNQKVTVLRDSGCSTIVVKRELVEDSQLTGKETTCVLIDETIRRTPLARIHILFEEAIGLYPFDDFIWRVIPNMS